MGSIEFSDDMEITFDDKILGHKVAEYDKVILLNDLNLGEILFDNFSVTDFHTNLNINEIIRMLNWSTEKYQDDLSKVSNLQINNFLKDNYSDLYVAFLNKYCRLRIYENSTITQGNLDIKAFFQKDTKEKKKIDVKFGPDEVSKFTDVSNLFSFHLDIDNPELYNIVKYFNAKDKYIKKAQEENKRLPKIDQEENIVLPTFESCNINSKNEYTKTANSIRRYLKSKKYLPSDIYFYLDSNVSEYYFKVINFLMADIRNEFPNPNIKGKTIFTPKDISKKSLKEKDKLYITYDGYSHGTFHYVAGSKFGSVISQCDDIEKIKHDCQLAAQTDDPILLLGKTGTGKEVFAKAIHYASKRANNSFVAINCGAIPNELLESELFGYEKGSHSLAKTSKEGLFETVEDGTIFLDEIGELPLELQVKLLRVLQEKKFRKVGGTKEIEFKARVISATNANIVENLGISFRSDLYYRINTFVFKLPQLKDRGKKDILLLTNYFLHKFGFSPKYNYKKVFINNDAKELLCQYSWPGNVRQLEFCIKRAVYMAIQKDKDIDEQIINAALDILNTDDTGKTNNDVNDTIAVSKEKSYKDLYKINFIDNFNINDFLSDIEKAYVTEALKKSKNQLEAGKLLGLTGATIGSKMERMGIPRKKSIKK